MVCRAPLFVKLTVNGRAPAQLYTVKQYGLDKAQLMQFTVLRDP